MEKFMVPKYGLGDMFTSGWLEGRIVDIYRDATSYGYSIKWHDPTDASRGSWIREWGEESIDRRLTLIKSSKKITCHFDENLFVV